MKRFFVLFALLLALFPNAYAGKPEFDGQCTMGLSEGRNYATDCSVLWLGPDDKIYCFANPEAKQVFLKAPKENISRAQAYWDSPENLKRLIRKE
jgi:hypothetical protein